MFEFALCRDARAWDNFVRRSPQGSVFATDAFLRSLGIAHERAVWRRGGRILAGVPVFLAPDGRPRAEPLPFIPYQGVMLDHARGRKRFRAIQQDTIALSGFVTALAERYGNLALAHSWTLPDLRPFLWLNADDPAKGCFDVRLRYTGLIDTTEFKGFDAYLATVAKSRRQQLAHARRTFTAAGPDDVETFFDIHDRAYAQHGIELSDEAREVRRRITTGAINGGYGRLVAAREGASPPAAVYLWLYDAHTAYHFFAANEPSMRASHGSTFLLLHMIADAFARGIERIDFCGVEAPGHGDYKLSFNAVPTPYFETRLDAPIPDSPTDPA